MRAENIKLLDCTLRDGGYVNEWEFGEFNIRRIISSLNLARIDIVECGYLSDKKGTTTANSTLFKNISIIENVLDENKDKLTSQHVVMIDHGEYEIHSLQLGNIRGIRYAYHKKHWQEAMNQMASLVEKGFNVYAQPMVTLNYTDEELLKMITEINKIKPYAFYVVDSFGAMRKEDLIRISTLVDHNLDRDVRLGYHAHNNLQLAFSNAVEFLNLSRKRKIIIDTSVFGMGRGAGNLPTELVVNHIKENTGVDYKIEPLLDIMDKCVSRIYSQKSWGYSTAHYLSAIYNCHPNYSNYLINKKTLSVNDIEQILKRMDPSGKVTFDKNYVEELYQQYNSNLLTDNCDLIKLKQSMMSKDVLIVAPGRSVKDNLSYIQQAMMGKLSISINYVLTGMETDYYFFSNQRRYDEYKEKVSNKLLNDCNRNFIFTSNIRHEEKPEHTINVDYNSLLNHALEEKDNSAILLLTLLKNIRVDEIFIAGLDGYQRQDQPSYLDENMEFYMSDDQINRKNRVLKMALDVLKNDIKLHFLTESIFIKETAR